MIEEADAKMCDFCPQAHYTGGRICPLSKWNHAASASYMRVIKSLPFNDLLMAFWNSECSLETFHLLSSLKERSFKARIHVYHGIIYFM